MRDAVATEIRICTQCRASYSDHALAVCPRDGGPLMTWADDPLIGRVLGARYQLVEPLGQGGMGSVYLAERLPDELEVAVKLVRPEHKSSATIQERFLREVRNTRSILSPHVVRILDAGMSEDGRAYMVMERLAGESLTERIRRWPALRTDESLVVARDIARALAAAHEAGVIHRDLKPDNIILCRDGTVKVVDFGIAKAFVQEHPHRVAEPSLTQAHRVVGTPAYMSPELINKGRLCPRSDLYALGVIMYEMLTGEPPFSGADAIGTMYMHLHHEPPLLREVDDELDVPDALEMLIRDLLAKQVDHRPADADSVVWQLDALIQMELERQRQTPSELESDELTKVWEPKRRVQPETPIAKPRRSRRSILLLAALVALVVIAVVAAAGVIYGVRARDVGAALLLTKVRDAHVTEPEASAGVPW